MYDLHELARKLAAAESCFNAARASTELARAVFNSARNEYRLEEYAARGVTPGCKVVVKQQRFCAGHASKFILVFLGFEQGDGTPEHRAILAGIKANGKRSKRLMNLSFIASIEPYEGSPEQAADMERKP